MASRGEGVAAHDPQPFRQAVQAGRAARLRDRPQPARATRAWRTRLGDSPPPRPATLDRAAARRGLSASKVRNALDRGAGRVPARPRPREVGRTPLAGCGCRTESGSATGPRRRRREPSFSPRSPISCGQSTRPRSTLGPPRRAARPPLGRRRPCRRDHRRAPLLGRVRRRDRPQVVEGRAPGADLRAAARPSRRHKTAGALTGTRPSSPPRPARRPPQRRAPPGGEGVGGRQQGARRGPGPPLLPIGPHACRYTFVTPTHQAGGRSKRPATSSAHTIHIHTDCYRHLREDRRQEAARRLDAYLALADTSARVEQLPDPER